MNKPVVLLGCGGHARALASILAETKRKIIAYVSPLESERNSILDGVDWIRDDNDVAFDIDEVEIVNGIGSLPGNNLRETTYLYYKNRGYKFATVLAKDAIVSNTSIIHEGGQIFPGAIVHVNVEVGENSIVNTGAIVDHDTSIGPCNHIAPGAVLCGGVITNKSVHVGAGATIIQGTCIGDNTIIGSGATVTKDILSNKIVYPARITINNLGDKK